MLITKTAPTFTESKMIRAVIWESYEATSNAIEGEKEIRRYIWGR